MESLQRKLDTFLASLHERVDAHTSAVLRRSCQTREEELQRNAMGEGQVAPDFALPDQDGTIRSLHAALADGPVVLTFFRGEWCPFCVTTLRALNEIVPGLKRAGASLLAISPQARPAALATTERNNLRFPVLSDHNNEVARRYGLVWQLGPDEQEVFRRIGHDLPRINGVDAWELPATASYIITPDGRIALAHVHAEINRRLEPAAALEAVRKLQAAHAK
jgi:peroxiredoxin